jgi:nucleoside-diphosphate-sugar epimerase
MKLLITGAFGNLGLMCVNQALKLGYSVRCFDIDIPAIQKLATEYQQRYADQLEVVLGDILDDALLPSLVAGVDAILHNASLLPPLTETKADLARRINVDACKKLIAEAEKLSPPPVFVFPSSVTVFGIIDGPPTERRPTDPIEATDNYTAHKIEIESSLQASTLPWVIGRVGVSVDTRTLNTDMETFKGLLNTRASNPMEYVHPKDIAYAMCRAATVPEARRKILLLGGGKHCQIDQHRFMGTAFRSLGLNLSRAVFGDQIFYTHWMDTTESQEILQFQRYDFSDYEEEMARKLHAGKVLLFPLRWLLNPLINTLLIKLRSS